MKLPRRIKETLENLIEEGYFKNKDEIISIALFEYFVKNGFFDLISEEDVKIKGK